MLFDTHAHYDDEKFEDDRESLLEAMPPAGVGLIVDAGGDLESSRAALALAERFEYVYAAVGYHPEELEEYSEDGFKQLEQLALHQKCVAIGEIGLDYYWDATHKAEQQHLFRKQVELALRLDKPVIVHDRDAHGDSMELVRDYDGLRGVFHCFSGSAEMAKELLARGWYLGFDGPITYKNARKALEVLALCPMERILIETDSPYLSPVPHRGERNDSQNLDHIVQKVAEIKGVGVAEAERATYENGCRLFGI